MLTIRDWLPDAYRAWTVKWFKDSEVDEAILVSGLTVRSITVEEVYAHEPEYITPREHVADNRHGHKHITMMHGGYEWERTEHFVGSEWRVRCPYQHLRFPALTRKLLDMKFPWFTLFSWQVYGYPGESERSAYEIYLDTGAEHETLYVPLDCMMSGDVDGILKRTLGYADWFNNDITSSGLRRAAGSEQARLLFKHMKGIKV